MTDALQAVELLPDHNGSEPIVQWAPTMVQAFAWSPGDLGFSTYWRPTPAAVGNATCLSCSGLTQARACHALGIRQAEHYAHKRTPHGRQFFAIGGASDGYFYVVVDAVSIDPLRQSYMSAWVHVAGDEWESDNTSALDGAFVNVWASVELVNGTHVDVYLLHTEGRDIHSMHWREEPNRVIEDRWVKYSADLPAAARTATMHFGADVPDPRASIWFDKLEIACA